MPLSNYSLTSEVAGTIFSKESRKERVTTVGLTISSRPETRVDLIFWSTLLNTRSSSSTDTADDDMTDTLLDQALRLNFSLYDFFTP